MPGIATRFAKAHIFLPREHQRAEEANDLMFEMAEMGLLCGNGLRGKFVAALPRIAQVLIGMAHVVQSGSHRLAVVIWPNSKQSWTCGCSSSSDCWRAMLFVKSISQLF